VLTPRYKGQKEKYWYEDAEYYHRPLQIKELRMVLSKIPDDEKIERDASIIKALADPTRLKIVYFLQHGERCVCELIEALERPQPTISHHLTILKNAGIHCKID